MNADLPLIDGRTAADVVEKIRATAPFYVPEWSGGVDGDAGSALAGVFGNMVVEVLQRLNRVPERHLAAFLDVLGMRLLPPRPAETVVVFTLAKDADRSALVVAGTQVMAEKTADHPELLFETDENVLAVPSRIAALYSTIPDTAGGREKVFGHTEAWTAASSFTIFHGTENLQEHALYLRQTGLFTVRSGVEIHLSGVPRALADQVAWSYTDADGRETLFEARFDGAGGRLILSTGAGRPELGRCVVNGIDGIWLKGVPKVGADGTTALARVKDAVLRTVVGVGTRSLPTAVIHPDVAFAGDVPQDLTVTAGGDFIRNLLPFGDKPMPLAAFHLASREVFSKRGARITLRITCATDLDVPIERVQGIGAVFSARLRGAGIATAGELLSRSDAQVAGIIRAPGSARPASSYLLRARNIREATAKAYYDKAGAVSYRSGRAAAPGPGLSWEYWNGTGWCAISDVADSTGGLLATGEVTFTCPADMAEVEVSGQRNWWIRVRLSSGDYGREFEIVNGQAVAAGFTPPRLGRITLSWDGTDPSAMGEPDSILTRNNLEWDDGLVVLRTGAIFRPFRPLADLRPAFYAGFDRPLAKGPIGLYLDLAEIDYARDFKPRVQWEVYDAVASQWLRLDAEDGTAGLTRAGIVRLVVPEGGVPAPLFGTRLHWLRAVLVAGEYAPTALGAGLPYRMRRGYLNIPRIVGKPVHLRGLSLNPARWRSWRQLPSNSPPIARGIYLNAARALQLTSVKNERPGSGNGLPDQSFTLARKPVFDEQVWVNEFGLISAAELDRLAADAPGRVSRVTDREGRVNEVWVRWEGRDDLLASGPLDRHYGIDRSSGIVSFGNGKRGRVLPAGTNNVRVSYRTGGGVAGNLGGGAIARMRTGIPLVDKVVNPGPSGGGVEGEDISALYRRGPHSLRRRDRAVTVEDYESLIRELFPGMALVKCLPVCDDRGMTRTGWLTVIIVPRTADDRPIPSAALRRRVEESIAGHGANVVTAPCHAVVTRPSYVRVSVDAALVPRSLDLAPMVETAALAALGRFLHPLTGGWDGGGWPFGRLVCHSDLYRLLEEVEGVDRVASMAVTAVDEMGRRMELGEADESTRPVDPYLLVSSGDHRVAARAGDA